MPLPHQLLAHLRRWKRCGQRFVVEWNSKPVKAIEKAFANAAADAGLGPDVTPHVLRHTAATWLMQSGTNPWEVAGFLGMSVEMLLERYGHHHPDHLSGARKAFAKHRDAEAEAVAGKERVSAKCWSEWQDLNLRPPRPERGALRTGGAGSRPGVGNFCARRRFFSKGSQVQCSKWHHAI